MGSVTLDVTVYEINIRYDCEETEAHWEIVRADGITEVYTVLNYSEYRYGRNEDIPENGLYLQTHCFYLCQANLIVTPTDLRYNEASITFSINLPECYNSSNVTESTKLRVQGMHYFSLHMLMKNNPLYRTT